MIISITNSARGDIKPISWPLPANAEELGVRPLYIVPEVGGVSQVAAEHLRGAAYLPVTAVNEESIYAQDNSEIGDLDLVTVEAKFDAGQLYENFRESFDSESVRADWRDPCLAKPVFAAVQLQRQQKQPEDKA